MRFQLRLSDCLTSVSAEMEKKLQQIKNKAEPVLAEAAYLAKRLGGSKFSSGRNIGASHFTQNGLSVMAVVERLQVIIITNIRK